MFMYVYAYHPDHPLTIIYIDIHTDISIHLLGIDAYKSLHLLGIDTYKSHINPFIRN
jgi:hypothetical protein